MLSGSLLVSPSENTWLKMYCITLKLCIYKSLSHQSPAVFINILIDSLLKVIVKDSSGKWFLKIVGVFHDPML